MLSRVACLSVAVLMGCSGNGSPPPAKSNVEQTDIDLGQVSLSPDGHDFAVEMRNVGGAPLKITDVALSCGCTSTGDFDARVPAGARLSIPLRVRPTSAGPGSSAVRVTTDEQPARTHRFTITWNAVADLEPDPLRISFGNVKPATKHDRAVTLRIHSPTAQVTAWECLPAHRLTAHREGDIVTVHLEAGDEIGSFTGSLTGTVVGAWPATVRVPIEWSVRQSVEAMPPRLFLGNVRPGEAISKSLVIASPLGEPFEVSDVQPREIEGLQASLRDGQGVGQRIEVHWTAPAAHGPHSGTIEVAFSQSESGNLVVPVSGYVVEATDVIADRAAE